MGIVKALSLKVRAKTVSVGDKNLNPNNSITAKKGNSFLKIDLQPAEGKTTLPHWPVERGDEPGAESVGDRRQEHFTIRVGFVDARLQSDDDQRIRIRVHVHRVSERVPGSHQSGSQRGWLFNEGALQERSCHHSECLGFGRTVADLQLRRL